MSKMIFKIDKDNPYWNTYDTGINRDLFVLQENHFREIYRKRIEAGDVLDLNEILRGFFIVPDISCYGWFVLQNRFEDENKRSFINIIHIDDEKLIFEITDLRRD